MRAETVETIPEQIDLAELNVQEAHLEKETAYGHSLWCWGCPACWSPEIAEREEWERGV